MTSNTQPTARELANLMKLVLQYMEHPDVLTVTDRMALPGSAVCKRIEAALSHF